MVNLYESALIGRILGTIGATYHSPPRSAGVRFMHDEGLTTFLPMKCPIGTRITATAFPGTACQALMSRPVWDEEFDQYRGTSGSVVRDHASIPPAIEKALAKPWARRNAVPWSERMPWWQ
jgi:hypothetical protein